jgi:hypothetical protein
VTRLSWLTPEPEPEPPKPEPVDPAVERDRRFRESQDELRRARLARDAAQERLSSYRRIKRWYQVGLAVCVTQLAFALVVTTFHLGPNPVGFWIVGPIGVVGGLIALAVHRESSLVEHVEVQRSKSTPKLDRTTRTYKSLATVLAEAEADYEVAVVGSYLPEAS